MASSSTVRTHPSALRADLYNLLDRVIDTGVPIEVERRGHVVRIVRVDEGSWLDRLPRREGVIVGDPEDLVEIEGLSTWDGGEP